MHSNRIIYLSTFAYGSAHEMFNAALLAMCCELGKETVVCRSTRSNYRAMLGLLEYSPKVTYKNVPTVAGSGRYALLARYIFSASLDCLYLIRSKKTDILILPFNNLFGLRMFNRLNRLLKRKVLIFCHGEMESIASDINRKGLLSKILYSNCRNFFLDNKLTIADGLYFSVLGDSIKNNLGHYLSEDAMLRFVSIDHPYIFKPLSASPRQSYRKGLRLGTVGSMSVSKGSDKLVEYAGLCKNKGLEVEISHTGRIVSGGEEIRQQGIVDISPQHMELTRQEYDKRLSGLDYILFFYDSDSYKITASGAIMDSLAIEKPVIALRNDYFDYIFEKFGTFGYLADNVDQMVCITEDILSGKLCDTFDFRTIKSKLTPQSIVYELRRVINKIELS